jgi:hypothetical protein
MGDCSVRSSSMRELRVVSCGHAVVPTNQKSFAALASVQRMIFGPGLLVRDSWFEFWCCTLSRTNPPLPWTFPCNHRCLSGTHRSRLTVQRSVDHGTILVQAK